MNLRYLAPRTVNVYVERVAKFAKHFGRLPDKLGPADVRAYLVYLVHKRRVSWSYYIGPNVLFPAAIDAEFLERFPEPPSSAGKHAGMSYTLTSTTASRSAGGPTNGATTQAIVKSSAMTTPRPSEQNGSAGKQPLPPGLMGPYSNGHPHH
ncbi:MAG: phage integrase N-terminal SAM-like domain-containing protein [Isosphaeraceae bacterium]